MKSDAPATPAVEANLPRRLYLRVCWLLLLLLGLFPLGASLSDVAADARAGIPTDHLATFRGLAGASWSAVARSAPGTARYITLLEYGYAVHELVFGILFVLIVVIPFRRRQPWAWWACWAVLIADVVYTLTFGRYDSTILRQSLIADIALPVLLLAQAPAFFGRHNVPDA